MQLRNIIILKKIKVVALVFLFFFSLNINADEWHIRSNRDSFTLKLENGEYTVGGKPASQEGVKNFLALLDTELQGECPEELKKGPLVTVRKNDEEPYEYYFYEEPIIKKGEACEYFNAPLFYSVPLHRIWFTSDNKLTLKVKDRLSFEYGKTKVDFVKKRGWWEVQGRTGSLVNHDFVEQVEKGLNDLKIIDRYHPEISKKNKDFYIYVGGKKYSLHEVSEKRWGIMFPSKKWILVAPQLSVFDDFAIKSLFEENAKEFRVVVDKDADLEERVKFMRKYRKKWNPNIVWMYKSVLTNTDDADIIRMEVADRLIEHPTPRSLGIIVSALKSNESIQLLSRLTKNLRAIHPQGDPIMSNDSYEEAEKKVKLWKAWWKDYSKNNPD